MRSGTLGRPGQASLLRGSILEDAEQQEGLSDLEAMSFIEEGGEDDEAWARKAGGLRPLGRASTVSSFRDSRFSVADHDGQSITEDLMASTELVWETQFRLALPPKDVHWYDPAPAISASLQCLKAGECVRQS